MFEIWFSAGYILLLAILLFAFVLWRTGGTAVAIAALIVGVPIWFGWEYARPTWTTGTISGTEVRRSDPDASGNTHDVQYIYMRNQADRGLELENEDSWWWLKRNSERIFNDAKTAADRNAQVTVMWNRWRSQLFSWHPNAIRVDGAGLWPLWSLRLLAFYAVSIAFWVGYFYVFTRVNRRINRD